MLTEIDKDACDIACLQKEVGELRQQLVSNQTLFTDLKEQFSQEIAMKLHDEFKEYDRLMLFKFKKVQKEHKSDIETLCEKLYVVEKENKSLRSELNAVRETTCKTATTQKDMLADIAILSESKHDTLLLRNAMSSSILSSHYLIQKEKERSERVKIIDERKGPFVKLCTDDKQSQVSDCSLRDEYDTIATITFPLKKNVSYFEFKAEPLWISNRTKNVLKISLPHENKKKKAQLFYDQRGYFLSPAGSFAKANLIQLPAATIRVDISELFTSYEKSCCLLEGPFSLSENFQEETATHYFYKGEADFSVSDPVSGDHHRFVKYGWQIEVLKTVSEPTKDIRFWDEDPLILIGRKIWLDKCSSQLDWNEEVLKRTSSKRILQYIITAYNKANQKHMMVNNTENDSDLWACSFNLKTVPYSFEGPPNYNWVEPTNYCIFEIDEKTD